MDERFTEEDTYVITRACVPIMLEALAYGTRFQATKRDWEEPLAIGAFDGRLYTEIDHSKKIFIYHIRVTNDERRRLIPILKELNQKHKKKA